MPEEVQEEMVRTIPGLENAEIVRHGYGVEYDHIDARELKRTVTINDDFQKLTRYCSDTRDQTDRWALSRRTDKRHHRI